MTIEKRVSMRNPAQAPIECCLLSSRKDAWHIDGVLCNFSPKGIYIESKCICRKGSVLIVRILEYPQEETSGYSQAVIRSIGLAEVKWVHPMGGIPEKGYGIGLKYLN